MTDRKQAIDTLIEVMNSGSYAVDVRAGAAEGLGFAGGEEAREALVKVIKGTSNAVELRKAAAVALGRAARA